MLRDVRKKLFEIGDNLRRLDAKPQTACRGSAERDRIRFDVYCGAEELTTIDIASGKHFIPPISRDDVYFVAGSRIKFSSIPHQRDRLL
jgi:hypothetical protein